LKLRQIKLAGFKTFVDPTTIRLDGQLAGIVGPNGCGKSNIMESVKWVLGSSSAKEMRGESMDSVIFSGTDSREPIGRASVELFFDNSLGQAPNEWAKYAEISVKRVIEKEKGSTYYINNTAVRRKDVADLFLGTGLGSHGYAIIGQNTVSQIVEAKPEELKNYLEEAAGVSKYKERRKDTEYRLRDTRDNLSRVQDLLREINQQITRLESQAQAAKKHNELQEKLKFTNAQILVLKKSEANERWQNAKQLVEKQETELEKQKAELSHVEALVEQARQEHISSSDQINNAQASFYEINSQVTDVETRLNNLNEKLQNIARIKEGSEEKFNQFDTLYSNYEFEINESHKQLKNEKTKLIENQDTLNKIRKEFLEIENQYNADVSLWQSVLENWQKIKEQSSIETATLDLTQNIINDLNLRQNSLSDELSKLNQDDAEINKPQGLIELDNKLSDLTDKSEKNKQKLTDLENTIHEDKNFQLESKGKVDEIQLKISSLQQLINKEFNEDNVKEWFVKNDIKTQENIFKKLKVKEGWEKSLNIILGSRVNSFQASYKVNNNQRPPHALTLIQASNEIKQDLNKNLTSAITLIESENNDIQYSITEWLSNVYICEEGQEDTLRSKLNAGEVLINKQGDIFGLNYQVVSSAEDTQNTLEIIKEVKDLERTLPSQIKILNDIKLKIEQNELLRQSLKNEIELADKNIKETESQRNELNIEYNKKLSVKELTENRKAKLQGELQEIKQKLENSNSALNDKTNIIKKLEQDLIEITNSKNDIENKKLNTENEFNEKRTELSQLEKNNQQIEFNIQLLTNKINELTDKKQRASDDKQELINRLSQSEDELKSLNPTELQEELKTKLNDKEKAENELNRVRSLISEKEKILRDQESLRLEKQHALNPIQEKLQQIKLDERETKVLFEQRCAEVNQMTFNEEEVSSSLNDESQLSNFENTRDTIENRIERMGPVNLAAINELESIRERQEYIQNQVEDLNQASKTLEDAIHKIDIETREKLKLTFQRVNENFTEFFKDLFNGGRAQLELLGQEILDTGIQVVAQPPGKKNTTIHLLSGGEKALTAIALVFALFKLNPAPFCLMDEVDAPLDDSNTERFSGLVKKMAINTQFLFVSHNKITMEIAEQLIGVTMQEAGVSRIVEVDLQQIDKMELVN
jgi:chromosome segregation protein